MHWGVKDHVLLFLFVLFFNIGMYCIILGVMLWVIVFSVSVMVLFDDLFVM